MLAGRVAAAQLRVALARALQYRVDFIVRGLVATFWVFWNVVPLLVVFHGRPSVAGWTFDEALVVMAWFQLCKAVLEGVVNPGLVAAVEHIRLGTLDTTRKPAPQHQGQKRQSSCTPRSQREHTAGSVLMPSKELLP